MSEVMQEVDERSKLAGTNRFELLSAWERIRTLLRRKRFSASMFSRYAKL
jgi:hypothetical protein